MITTRKIQVGVWGYGHHAQKNVIPALLTSKECDLVGICTTNDDKESKIKEKYKVSVWRDPEEMLSDSRVQAVYLATPIGLHYIQGRQVLNANKHLACEKSLTNDARNSLNLISYAKEKGLVIFETFMYLYHPQFQLVQEMVCSEDFGAITSIVCNFCIPTLETPGFRNSKVLGGGAFWDVGCYPVSLVLALIKESPKVEFCEVVSEDGVEVDVSGRVLLKYPSGAVAYLNWAYNHSYKNDLTILGKNQSIYVNRVFSKMRDLVSIVTVMDKFGIKVDSEVPAVDSFVEMFKVFARAVRDNVLKQQLSDQARVQAELMSRLVVKLD